MGDDGPMSAAVTVGTGLDPESCYRAVKSRDRRFDGVFYTAVRTTGIYCRPVVPGADPRLDERHLPPERRGRPGGRLPRLQALPARRDPGQPRLGRRRRRGRPRDAADRRRRRRPRGRRRAGPAGRLHPAAPQPAAHRRARRRPARPGPGPPRADRAGADRDDATAPTPTSRSRPASPASGSSTTPSARCTPPRPTELRGRRGGRPRDRHRDHAAGGPHPVRRPGAARLPRLPPHPGRRGRRRRAGTPAPSTCRTARARSASTLADAPEAGRDGVRHRDVRAARPPRHRRGGRAGPAPASTPTATRWRSTTTSPATR